MAVASFQDLPLAVREREGDGASAQKRVRSWAGAEGEPNQKYRDAHVRYDADETQKFTAYKLLVADFIDGKLKAVPRGVMAPGNIMRSARAGIELPPEDVDRRSRATWRKHSKKMDDSPPWGD